MITATKIWLSSPHMGGSEQEYVREAFDSNWIAPLGPNVDAFEKSLESYLGDDLHVAALSSGTGAIHLGLKILGVDKGDEVLCQSFTFSASANPILYLGATPVFIDSEKESWNISPELLEIAIQDRLNHGVKPKAIIAVHLYGMPYKVDEVAAIAAKYQIPVLEDSAEALGSRYKGQKCGGLADIAILSFNGNKIITTSGGGALVAKTLNQKKKAVFYSTQSRDKAPHYQHSEIGFNYRMSNVLAGIGRGQMEVLEDRVLARRANYEFYKSELNGVAGIQFVNEPHGSFSNRWLTTIITPSYEIRERIRTALQKDDIESRPLWKPMHMQPVFQRYTHFADGTSEALFEKGLCLPSGSNLSQHDLTRIVSVIKKELLYD